MPGLQESAEFAQGEIEKNIASPPPNYAKGYRTKGGPEKLETLKNVLSDLAKLRPERDE